MVNSPDRGINWFSSKEALGLGARSALMSPLVPEGEYPAMINAEDFYYRLGHPRRGLDNFPPFLQHPLFESPISSGGRLTSSYREVYDPINIAAAQFIQTLEDPDVKAAAERGLKSMIRLSMLVAETPTALAYDAQNTGHTMIHRVTLLR